MSTHPNDAAAAGAAPEPVELRGAGGLRLAADAFGDPAGPPVVLLHGGGQTRHAWGGTAQALGARGFRALALDLRGHGDSGWPADGDYSADAFVADVRAVAASCSAPPALVGASLGGLASLLAEGEEPVPIASALVLVDVAPRLEPDGVERIVAFMTAQPDGFASLEEAADAIAAYLPHRDRPSDVSGLAKNLRRGEDGRLRWHWDPRFMAERAPRISSNPERLLRAARALRVPTLLVRGRRSDLLSESGAREFLEHVPHARFTDVSGAGHMVAGDRNDAFTRAVLAFLEGLRG